MAPMMFAVGFLVLHTTRLGYGLPVLKRRVVESRRDAVEMAFLAAIFVGTVVLPLVYLTKPQSLAFAEYDAWRWLPWVGAPSMIGASWLFWRSHADLGRNWSVTLELREDHTLITHGIYERIRHPMYAAVWLWGIGQLLLLPNWLAGGANLLAFIPLYLVRVPREERMMLDHFGVAYRSYMRRTGRVWPRRAGDD
ncbi:MAG: isoprenylcysteine carboxylmethyltransferase family protein [Phycisphaera sp.]|nr:isoprenylcysteine carboxylmethyltransferase family protein [Phycisphaera sp.]